MRFGCCGNMVASRPDKTGVEIAETLAKNNFDYIELPLAEMVALSDRDFVAVKTQLDIAGIPCESCNNFFPAHVRLTGSDVDFDRISAYLEKALDRAGALRVKTIVFGSGIAKKVPEGFPYDVAYEQLTKVTEMVSAAVEPYGITVAIEPTREPDSNIINTFAEGVEMARNIDKGNIKVLTDNYHVTCLQESLQAVREYGKDYLAHVHISFPNIPMVDDALQLDEVNPWREPELKTMRKGRKFPSLHDGWDYKEFVDAIRSTGYDGRVTVEAFSWGNLDQQIKDAKEFLVAHFT